MKTDSINWELVRAVGVTQGATRHAVSKWRQRKMVPHKWRAHLVAATNGRIRWDHFEDMDKARDAS